MVEKEQFNSNGAMREGSGNVILTPKILWIKG